jgi:RNA polymerase sigma-70 factor (ECF subfamily)
VGTPIDQSDATLVQRAKRGDRSAMALLLERHAPALRRGLAGRIPARLRSVLSEDDVMQQSHLDAALGIDRFEDRGPGAFPAWMGAIARFNLLDAISMLEAEKRGGGRVRLDVGHAGDSHTQLYERLGTASHTPSRVVARDEARSALERALETLPVPYRRVVDMYDLQGRPIEDVAAELGRSPGAVYMLRARAHDRLKEQLGSASRYMSDAPR